jgi:hypothetical protein
VLGLIVVVVASYNLSYLLVSDLYAVILIATTMHSLEYHVLCWRPNRKRFQESQPVQRLAPVLSTLPPERAGVAFGVVLAGAGALCASLMLVGSGFVPLVLILHHFYLDGVIWKGAKNPNLAASTGTGGAAPAAVAA